MTGAASPTTTFDPGVPRPSTVLLRSRVAVIVAVALAVMVGLLAALNPAWLLAVDEPVSEWLRDLGLHRAFSAMTQLGASGFALVVGAIGVAALWRRCRAFALAIPTVLVLALVVNIGVKLVVDRPRPPNPVVGTALGSFPSGHVITGVIVLGLIPPAVWILTEKRGLFRAAVALLLLGVPLVALSRVNLGAHWPSDVLASLLIGAALLLAAEYFVASEWACTHCAGCPLHRPAR